jgi:hypothetical protein
MKRLAIIALVVLSSCTYTISMVHTEGQASDVIDETSTPTANVSPTVTIPASVIGK